VVRRQGGIPSSAQRTIASARKRSATNDVATWYALLTEIYRDSVRHDLGWYKADRHLFVMRRGKRVDTLHIGGPFATFTANLSMSDAALREMFDIWLDEARKQRPAPRTKRGPRRHNSEVSSELFARWRAKKIIEYAHLMIWRARDRRRRAYSVEVIAEWIGRGTDKARRETLCATHSLASQRSPDSASSRCSKPATSKPAPRSPGEFEPSWPVTRANFCS
jgi:hypothetical protein